MDGGGLMSSPDQRAGWISGMRTLLDILEANPELPLPSAGSSYPLHLPVPYGRDRAVLAMWERALPVQLTAHIRDGGSEVDVKDGNYYDLDGDLDGLKVRARAHTDHVAEKRVTGTTTVETVEWVRFPTEDLASGDVGAEDAGDDE